MSQVLEHVGTDQPRDIDRVDGAVAGPQIERLCPGFPDGGRDRSYFGDGSPVFQAICPGGPAGSRTV